MVILQVKYLILHQVHVRIFILIFTEECHKLYTWAIPHIFGHNPWRLINPFRSKYSDKAKQELMQYYFGERTMADLNKSCAAVAFRLDGRKSKTHSFFHREGWRPAVFSNIPKAAGAVDPDLDLKVIRVLR